jgi:hypothetical protein
MTTRRSALSLAAAVLAAGILAGCGGGSDDGPESELRILHGAPGAPNIDIYVDSELVAGNLPYKGTLGYAEYNGEGVQVRLAVAGTQTVLLDTYPVLGDDDHYTMIVINPPPNIQTLLIQTEPTDLPSGRGAIRVAHAAPSAPAVDFYVTAPGADLAGATPTYANVGYRGSVPAVPLVAGPYQVRVTPSGSKAPIYDSGTVTLSEGQDLMPVLLDQPQGPGTLTLVVMPQSGTAFEWPAVGG